MGDAIPGVVCAASERMHADDTCFAFEACGSHGVPLIVDSETRSACMYVVGRIDRWIE